MNSAPNIQVLPFSDTPEAFERYARDFFSPNEQYRGYDKLIDLANSYNLHEYDLYEARCDEVLAGVAAIRLHDNTLYFDIFAVDEAFRTVGVGDILFSEIIAQEKYAGATAYESMALPGDRSTKNFFEQRQGKARLLIVSGPLGSVEPEG
ncbi:MAG TPA: GNAT family N-acetyltransferase [Acidimicrobiia bacterium]|nr:GNAT family N-acetyltransferase [Acidimicrobiia bacterium]